MDVRDAIRDFFHRNFRAADEGEVDGGENEDVHYRGVGAWGVVAWGLKRPLQRRLVLHNRLLS